jgi:hypothetical protein
MSNYMVIICEKSTYGIIINNRNDFMFQFSFVNLFSFSSFQYYKSVIFNYFGHTLKLSLEKGVLFHFYCYLCHVIAIIGCF